MKDSILKMTLGNKRNMFLRRIDAYGKPILTNIQEMARKFHKKDIPSIIRKIIATYGKDNVKDIGVIIK